MAKFKLHDRVRREVDVNDKSKGYKSGRIVNVYSKPKQYLRGGLILGPYPELYSVLWDNGKVENGFLPHGLDKAPAFGKKGAFKENIMAVCGKWHKELDENGVGKCSVPMWCNGVPAGFCDMPAYGKPLPFNDRYNGYVPYLACPFHGGPKTNEAMEGENNPWHGGYRYDP